MRVHLIKEATMRSFALVNAGSKSPFEEWLTKVKQADWEKPGDIKATFPSADLLGNGCCRVVFDIGGNNFRMICKYAFAGATVRLYVCWVGTHAAYDKLCKRGEQYFVFDY